MSWIASTERLSGSPFLIVIEEAKLFLNVGAVFTLIFLSPLAVMFTVFGSHPWAVAVNEIS